jgi:phosphate transport system protein
LRQDGDSVVAAAKRFDTKARKPNQSRSRLFRPRYGAAGMGDRQHIYKTFDHELRSLKDQIQAMGELVTGHVTEAMRGLHERDVEIGSRIFEADRAVNHLELAIDEQCIRMLALRQPAAKDLRFIAAALKIVTDLERIGDLAVNMAERAAALAIEPQLRALRNLPRMAEAAQTMLRQVLAAFVHEDAEAAERVMAADQQVDDWLTDFFDEALADMKLDPDATKRGITAIFFAKHIERMADHTTNVAEMVIYLVRGQDVRHSLTR